MVIAPHSMLQQTQDNSHLHRYSRASGLLRGTGVAHARILVIKHGALGDLIQGLDAFAGLRAGHPNAHIALLTTPPFGSFAGRMPWFDEVITDRRSSALNICQTLRIRGLFRAGWHMVIDLQCSQRTARYHRFLTRRDCRWFGTAAGASDPYPDFTGVNNAERMTTGIAMAGGDATVKAELGWMTDAATVPPECEGATVLVPGCSLSKPRKRWPASRFAELARRERDAGQTVVIVGTAADRDAADLVIREAPHCLDLVGKTDLSSLAALMTVAGTVVGNDTGPVFLAARSGAPTLMIMGPDTDPSMSAPVGARADWIRKESIADIAAIEVADALVGLRGRESDQG